MLAGVDMIYKILFLCLAGFLSAFVDSIAGGGGLISVPAYFMIGFPAHYSLGTNKFSATCGTLTSALSFAKSGKTDKDILKVLLPFTLIGSMTGTYIVMIINSEVLKPIIMAMLMAVGIYSFVAKSVGQEDNFVGVTKKNLIIGSVFAFIMGFYDGFFGPGTGSFLIFGLIKIYGFDFVRASGNAKAMNLVSGFTALAVFAISGKIYYLMGIPMAIFMIVGARVGSRLAIKNGSKIIRPIFIVMSLGVAVKMIYELTLM
ncbi:TSUP family transporter [Tissierella sp. Yu-01]|uniref:sulfite exporter TauE/SafE family protein n=1 Tax=Tissierella sp. Yu-01 TaxID=3035694 RepID=UPI00240E7E38|nr:TSUP family transporter [Tissierella sp. Yu-01]WFA07955.1 TSUP family transporter [Tissierella sp. Yu-01]